MDTRVQAKRSIHVICIALIVVTAILSLERDTVRASVGVPGAYLTPKNVGKNVFTVGDQSEHVLYLHEAMAMLGYLPLNYVPSFPTDVLWMIDTNRPSMGHFEWTYANTPTSLREVWDPQRYNVLTKGAVMTFQLEHGLPVDGFAGPTVFRALDIALRLQLYAKHGYRYVYVDQRIPQTVKVWDAGRWVFQAPCSTGIKGALTHVGTYPIYLRNRSQTMDGIAPSGRRYRVEGVPYVSFFYRGEALHGLVRARYGFPQSVGCVEMAVQDAKRLWGLTDYGTIVGISPLRATNA